MKSKRKNAQKAKEPVRIRLKQLSNNNQSIYFDTYRNGKRSYDFPKLYIVPENSETDKETNRETIMLANKIKARMILEINCKENNFDTGCSKMKEKITDYIMALAEKKRTFGTRGVYHNYMGLMKHLVHYRGENITFNQITKEFCTGFNEYLKTANNRACKSGDSKKMPAKTLLESTQYGYSRLLSVVINCAIQEGMMQKNPMKALTRFERPKLPESSREYLTVEEVKILVKTPCEKSYVKQAFLFTCFSGLRFSDVSVLKWGDIQTDNMGQKLIRYTQKKTMRNEYLQIPDEALKFMPERKNAKDHDIIFPLTGNGYTNKNLAKWVLKAGIKKRVTFHTGRHTNATLLLSLGAPIETVSKLLGHTNIKTTQIYAKVIDKNKRDAVNNLNGLTGE